MAFEELNPRPAPGFRRIDLNDCEAKCKCFCGPNKGDPYYKDEPCIAKDSFIEETCECGAYPVGVNFTFQYPAIDDCYPGQNSTSCCCGETTIDYGGTDPCGRPPWRAPCGNPCECPGTVLGPKDGCTSTVSMGGPGIILEYGNVRFIGTPSPTACDPPACPPASADCKNNRPYNDLYNTNVDYIIAYTSNFPFYQMLDARSTTVRRTAVRSCCGGESDVYGNCLVPRTPFNSCQAADGAGGDLGIANCAVLEATVLIGDEEVSVAWVYPNVVGGSLNGENGSAIKLIATSLRMQKDAQTPASPEYIYGSIEAIQAAGRRGLCGVADCPPPDNPCPIPCPTPPPTCTRTIDLVFGEDPEVWDKYRWQPPCW